MLKVQIRFLSFKVIYQLCGSKVLSHSLIEILLYNEPVLTLCGRDCRKSWCILAHRFFWASVCLRISSAVIDEGKKVLFAWKSDKVNRANQIYMYELIRRLKSFLWVLIIDFGYLDTMTAIINIIFCIIYIVYS